jgi:cystathionine gamma-lyase
VDEGAWVFEGSNLKNIKFIPRGLPRAQGNGVPQGERCNSLLGSPERLCREERNHIGKNPCGKPRGINFNKEIQMTDKKTKLNFATRTIHAGQSPDPTTGAVMMPIYATSTYVQESPGKHKGYEYSRTQNPTRMALERCVADLEGGKAGFAFASGMAATATILDLLNHGDHVIASDDLYGGTFRLFDKVRARSAGLKFTFLDMTKPETIANWIQRPLQHGFNIVMHSTTKYLNGHSDIIGGMAVVGDDPGLIEQMSFLQNSIGAIAGPFDSFLALRGLKTLAIRMERHCTNALTIAQWLCDHPQIERVIYPGLPTHPQHALAKKQMCGFGGIVTVVLKGNLSDATRFLERCKLFSLAESLGGVESLIEHPAIMTHASIPQATRQALGISDTLIRLSVGIEHVDDLIQDLQQALEK